MEELLEMIACAHIGIHEKPVIAEETAGALPRDLPRDLDLHDQSVLRSSSPRPPSAPREISISAAKRSQEFVSETVKKSSDLVVEATKTADFIKTESLRCTDQINSLAADIPIPLIPRALHTPPPSSPDLEQFGITDELREFAKGIMMSTFRDFLMEDEPMMEEVTTVPNVRQHLNEWQATHVTLFLSTVKRNKVYDHEAGDPFI